MIFCILCGHGHMSYNDMIKECKKENWLPILVIRTEEGPVVPLFTSEKIATQFIRRNLSKSWTCGVVVMTLRDAEWMDKNGWRALEFSFPKKLKDVVEFDVEILECEKVSFQRGLITQKGLK